MKKAEFKHFLWLNYKKNDAQANYLINNTHKMQIGFADELSKKTNIPIEKFASSKELKIYFLEQEN